jgi:hypothetical protein
LEQGRVFYAAVIDITNEPILLIVKSNNSKESRPARRIMNQSKHPGSVMQYSAMIWAIRARSKSFELAWKLGKNSI